MPGQAIFLNGASSSGKSTLARALQGALDDPFVYMAEDMFFTALPARTYPERDAYRYGARLYHGFTRCIRTLLDCDNNVIVDTVAWVPGSIQGFADALWDTQVIAVGLHSPLHILEQRERDRKDRGLGLARKQVQAVHRGALYDIEIDTSLVNTADAVQQITLLLAHPPSPHAFAQMRLRTHGTSTA